MSKKDSDELRLSGRLFLKVTALFQIEAEGEFHKRRTRAAGQTPALEDQSDLIEGEIVEDISPDEIDWDQEPDL